MDNRIGIRKTNETQWPERSISGREYRRPCTTVGIDDHHFVVIDIFPVPGYEAEIEKLRGSMTRMSAPPVAAKSASKGKDNDDGA